MSDALHAAFFIATEDKAHGLLRSKPCFFQRLYRVQTCNHRSFVVHGAAPVQIAVDDYSLVRRILPLALNGGYYVKVTEYTEHFLAATDKVGMSCIAVTVVG